MLSILIPTYNYSVVNLTENIHKQTINANIPFEIIVVDDASFNKNTLEENKSINLLSHCRLIENTKNLGRTACRNLLANKASYNYLLFLDADVLPVYSDFISRFNLKNQENISVIFGGVNYYDSTPNTSEILRWKYGKSRETKTVKDRKKHPYFIISQNLLIEKELFLTLNTSKNNCYGLDILFSANLKKSKTKVNHIDNPVYHLGLESNTIFIKKSVEAVKTTFQLEQDGLIENDLRPLQKSYNTLKKWHLSGLFTTVFPSINSLVEKNLHSKNPSIFLFDLFRLYHFSKLKNDA